MNESEHLDFVPDSCDETLDDSVDDFHAGSIDININPSHSSVNNNSSFDTCTDSDMHNEIDNLINNLSSQSGPENGNEIDSSINISSTIIESNNDNNDISDLGSVSDLDVPALTSTPQNVDVDHLHDS